MIINEKDDLDKRHPQDGKTVSNQNWELRDLADALGVSIDDVKLAKQQTQSKSRDEVIKWIQNNIK